MLSPEKEGSHILKANHYFDNNLQLMSYPRISLNHLFGLYKLRNKRAEKMAQHLRALLLLQMT